MDSNHTIEEIARQFNILKAQGEQPVLEDLCKECPELIDAVKRQINEAPGYKGLDINCSEFASVSSNFNHLLDNLHIEGYTILEEIGSGGQGVVLKARQNKTGRNVAVKLMLDSNFMSKDHRDRFEREISTLSTLEHPNIITIIDRGIADNGYLYFITNYVKGIPLDQWVTRYKFLNSPEQIPENPAKILLLFLKISNAVSAAHKKNIIHRDLKPGNIIIDENDEPYILDFGLSRSVEECTSVGSRPNITLDGQFLGSLPWASPEQAEGIVANINERTDVYSLGVILYQMLTDQFPYEVAGNMRDVLNNIVNTEPTPPSTIIDARIAKLAKKHKKWRKKHLNPVTGELEDIILKALSKKQANRYTNAGEFSQDISNYLTGKPSFASQSTISNSDKLKLAGAAVLLLCLCAAIFLLQQDKAKDSLNAGSLLVPQDHVNEPITENPSNTPDTNVAEAAKNEPILSNTHNNDSQTPKPVSKENVTIAETQEQDEVTDATKVTVTPDKQTVELTSSNIINEPAPQIPVLIGNGTIDSPYLINSLDDLKIFADKNYSDKYWAQGVYTRLNCNIDLSSERYSHALIAWDESPEDGFQGNSYQGIFDGSNYSIVNLAISSDHSLSSYIGLFGKTNNAIIKNLKAAETNLSIIDDSYYAGAIVGYAVNTKIHNCKIEKIALTGNGSYAGGILGKAADSEIRDSEVSGLISSKKYVGGVCGESENTLLTSSEFIGKIQANSIAGGIIGSTKINSKIYQCIFIGDCIAAAEICGGITGYCTRATISECYAFSNISARTSKAGGISGIIEGSDSKSDTGSINDCFFCGNVTSVSYAGGLAGNSINAKIRHCFAVCNAKAGKKVGGLAGDRTPWSNTIEGSFWDQNYLVNNAIDSDKALSSLQYATFKAWEWDIESYSESVEQSIWVYEDNSYPTLRWAIKEKSMLLAEAMDLYKPKEIQLTHDTNTSFKPLDNPFQKRIRKFDRGANKKINRILK